MQLTIQLYLDQTWQDIALLEISQPELGVRGPITLIYLQHHALDWMFRDDGYACSLTLPVELMLTYRHPRWFGFLEDIMPAGASRRYWITHLGLQDAPAGVQDSALLQHGTIAPVGNLRIKEAVPERLAGSRLEQRRFTLQDVVERHTDFLEYAQQMGAASGGATGAGGEAPKLLLRRSPDDQIWIDTWQDDPHQRDAAYLVKFPRGQRSQDDCDILRAEYHYYQELAALGIDTIETTAMQLIEGDRYPSLWLLVGHLQRQFRVTQKQEPFDTAAFVSEWVKRDLLNVAFGNSDNHGRNAALIKRPEGIWHAPVYDFAPMKADPEGVTRSTRWGSPYEEGGDFDWLAIAEALDDLVPAARLLNDLRALAAQLVGLQQRLAERGVPERILHMPAVGLVYLEDRLQNWKLL